jgi:hypothetical protein
VRAGARGKRLHPARDADDDYVDEQPAEATASRIRRDRLLSTTTGVAPLQTIVR